LKDFFSTLIRRVEKLGVSLDITLYTLTLGAQDATTGWYAREYDRSTIKGVFSDPTTSSTLYGVGTYSINTAVLFSKVRLLEGDIVKDAFGYHYTVMTMQLYPIGDTRVFYRYNLDYLPTFVIPEEILPPEGPWGFEMPYFEEDKFEHGVI